MHMHGRQHRHKSCETDLRTHALGHMPQSAALTMTFTSRHVTSRHVTSRHVTSRHVTPLHVTSLHVTSLRFTSLERRRVRGEGCPGTALVLRSSCVSMGAPRLTMTYESGPDKTWFVCRELSRKLSSMGISKCRGTGSRRSAHLDDCVRPPVDPGPWLSERSCQSKSGDRTSRLY